MIFINSMDFFTWNIIVVFCAMSLFHVEHWRFFLCNVVVSRGTLGRFYKKGNHKGLPLQRYLSILWIVSRGTLSLFSVQFRCFTWNIGVFFCAMSLFHVEHWGVFIKRATTRDCPYNDIYQFYGIVSRGTLSFFSVQRRCFTWNIIVVFCAMSLFHVEHWGVFIKRATTRDCPYNDIYQFYGLFHVEHWHFFLCNVVVSRGTLGCFYKKGNHKGLPLQRYLSILWIVSRGTLSLFSVQCRCFTWNIGAFL